MITKDEALEYLLGTTCAGCGGKLGGPGEPCTGCGTIPAVTAPELEADLQGPVALAAVEARKLRAEAWAEHDAAVAKMVQADRAVFTARLLVRRDQAQTALDEHVRAHKGLYSPRTAARKAEEAAAAELSAATAEHAEFARAEELARRMKHGVKAETEAAQKLDAATTVLRRYQAALAEATAKRERAETAFDVSAARMAALEAARDSAAAAVADPGRIPLSGESVTLGGYRLILSAELDEVELMMAGQTARLICAATGITGEIENEIRAAIARETEQQARRSPVAIGQHQGAPVAVPNPMHLGQPPSVPGGVSTAPPPPASRPGFH